MPQILKTFSDARLQLAGKGAYRKYLEVLIKKFKIDKSIDFLGQVSKEQLYSLYANASVVVQPSIYESFGTPIVEAMSMGKPVVASCVGGIPELITNGKEGLLVEPRNSLQLARAITKILSDESLRKKLASNARKRVAREFTWKTIAKKTIELYEQTLDGC
jgi:glycosyltransferase involved in cell wall biosynthesis